MGNLSEIKAVEQAMQQTTNKRMYERYLAVRLRLEGHTLEQISKTLHRTRKTVGDTSTSTALAALVHWGWLIRLKTSKTD